MNIVIDTNVIVAALFRRGIVRRLLVGSPGVFLVPESCLEEVWDTRQAWNRRGALDSEIADDLAWMVERALVVMPRSAYRDREGEAATLIADADDIPVVALALSVPNEGIWTFNTRDFAGLGLIMRARVLTTSAVKALLEARGAPS